MKKYDYTGKIQDYIDTTVEIPPFCTGRKILIRGSAEWEDRERIRMESGHKLLGFGEIAE